MLVSAIIIYLPPKENQLYFNLVLIYTDNKVKSKEGKRRNGFAIIFFSPENETVVDEKGGMFPFGEPSTRKSIRHLY